MKILITTDWYKPAINGVVTSVLNLSDELIKRGHEVKILTLSKTISSVKLDNIYYIGSMPFNVYPGVRISHHHFDYLLEELVEWKPDVIHSQCEFFTYTYAKMIAYWTEAPIVHTYHTMYEEYSEYLKINRNIAKYLAGVMSKNRLKGATVIIAPTNKVLNKLRSYNIDKEIKTIPTGLDISKFDVKFNEKQRERLLEKYNIPKDGKILLYLGRLGKEKNIEELLNKFSNLIKNNDNIYLIIVGGGPYQKQLEDKVYRLGIYKNVKFTGMIAPDQVPYYYKVSDIFVSASQSETQGLTYIEAICNGLPLVCKYDRCLDDVLINGYNGYFFNTNVDFIKIIEKLFSDEELYCKMVNNALEKSKMFSKKYFADSVFDVYKLAIKMNESKPNPIEIHMREIKALFNPRRQIRRINRLLRSEWR